MSDLISRQDALSILYDFAGEIVDTPGGHYNKAYKEYRKKLESLPSADAVNKGVFDQIKWERDVAIQTLEEHGIGFGEAADRPKGDIIYIEALEDIYDELEAEWNEIDPEYTHDIFKDIRERTWKIPSADRPKGKWIVEHTGNGWSNITCSECGYKIDKARKYNFCPNCGADMKGDTE